MPEVFTEFADAEAILKNQFIPGYQSRANGGSSVLEDAGAQIGYGKGLERNLLSTAGESARRYFVDQRLEGRWQR